jgi:transcriptional regulator with XRE-family HTH domain
MATKTSLRKRWDIALVVAERSPSEVAREFGVSKRTINRVLAGDLVSEPTLRKIEAFASKYCPRGVAA